MYICKESGLEVYETFQEILDREIMGSWEYQNDYYIKIKSNDNYDNGMYAINKETGEISLIYFTEFISETYDKAKQIDPSEIRIEAR